MHWTLEQVAAALGVAPPGGLDPLVRVAGVSIDSRTVGPGELFIAVHGPRHDGHDFLEAALARGALAGVVSRARSAAYPGNILGRLFVVDDPLAALQKLAQAVRRAWAASHFGRRLAAVTGSSGKTTTKEILAALLSSRFRVMKSEGNLNNEFGLPLVLLKLEEDHEAAVVELGMSRRGELMRLARTAEPEIGLITNVAAVHLEFFASVDEIALAKRELIEGLAGPDPVAVLNADDARVARFGDGFRGRVVTYGLGAAADFRADKIEDRGAEGSSFDLVGRSGRTHLRLALPGRHNIRNAVGALAAASEWGIGPGEAAPVFSRLAPAAMRGELLRFAHGFAVINDCYNSNPAALVAMAGVLAATPEFRRRILAAGEMLELGPTSAELHREAGRQIALAHVDWIVGVQGDAREIVRGAALEGHPEEQTRFFASAAEAAEFLAGFLAPGDLLVVKGSRGVKMEQIVRALEARFAVEPAGAGPVRG